MSKSWYCSVAVVLATMACDSPRPSEPELAAAQSQALPVGSKAIGHANGEGVVDVGVPTDFVFTAILRADGSASGEGFHHAPLGSTVIEFRTRVTCVSIDPVNKRAWIGGVIAQNNSTDPARMQPRHAMGRDIWWRVVDYGNGLSGKVDRSTFLGFTGDAGIQTSAEYCAVRPWPGPEDNPPQPVDARTNPLISGNISVKLN
jgi:hypothetical protein